MVEVKVINRSKPLAKCPACGAMSKRHLERERTIACFEPFRVKYSVHACVRCPQYFTVPLTDLLATQGNKRSRKLFKWVRKQALQNMSSVTISRRLREEFDIDLSESTICDWRRLPLFGD